MLSVRLYVYVCTYVRLASAWTVGRILFIFGVKSLFIIGLCSVNVNISAPKIWAFRWSSSHKMAILPKMALEM
jgi:hypothetical protein